jgi:hypothetical protein
LFIEPLPSNGYCIGAYFPVVAYWRVYMPHCSCQPVQVYQHHLRSRVVLLTFLLSFLWNRLLHDVQSLTSDYSLHDLQFEICPTVLLNVLLLPGRSRRLRPRSFMPLLRYVAPDVCSRTSVLYGFRVQLRRCLVPEDSVACAVQEWHGGSTVLRQRPTSSGTHQFWVRLFVCRRRPTARCRSPGWSFRAPIISTMPLL